MASAEIELSTEEIRKINEALVQMDVLVFGGHLKRRAENQYLRSFL